MSERGFFVKYNWPIEDVGNLGEVTYTSTALGVMSDYKTEEINGEKYIKEAGEAVHKYIVLPEGNKLILSLLETVKEPSVWDWTTLPSITPFDNIKKWLIKYGLPGFDQGLFYTHGMVYPLELFEKHVATIFLMFKLYESIYFETEEALFKYWSALIKHPDFEEYSQKLHKELQRNFSEKTLENKKASALGLLSMIITHEIENIKLQFNGDQFWLKTVSVFDICYYQFGCMLTKNDDSTWKNIKKCANCQTYFWGHGNKRYCDRCDRRTVWSREHPRPKKGGF